jgi:hypothetical protein
VKGVPELRKRAAESGVADTGAYVEWLEERVIELFKQVDELGEGNTENLHGRVAAENALLSPRVGPMGL